MSAAAKKDVEEMVTYIGTTEYKSFSQDYDMHVSSWFRAYVVLTAPSLAHAFENYDRYLEAGKWQMASTMKSTIVEYSSRIVSNSVVGVCYLSSGLSLTVNHQTLSGGAATLKKLCGVAHRNIPKVDGKCAVCFATEFQGTSFHSSVVRREVAHPIPSSAPNPTDACLTNAESLSHANIPTSSSSVAPSQVLADIAVPLGDGAENPWDFAHALDLPPSSAVGQRKRQTISTELDESVINNEYMTVFANPKVTTMVWKYK
jgi:hypothetical protein